MREFKRIPFNDLRPGLEDSIPDLMICLAKVIQDSKFILGPRVDEFEKKFAQMCCWYNKAYCVGVASGTDAIEIALRSLLHGPGPHEVITVANSAPATVAAIIRAGGMPVYVDVDERGLMDASKIISVLSPRTASIVPVHLYGQICDIEAIDDAAPGIPIIEDAAQAFGSIPFYYKPYRKSYAACFSFYPTKALGALGDGGAIVTQNESLAECIRRIRFYGGGPGDWELQEFGVNSRLDEIQAAILLERIKTTELLTSRRQQLAMMYFSFLPSNVLSRRYNPCENYHIFNILVPDNRTFRKEMDVRGVGTSIHYPIPQHHQKPTIQEVSLPKTESWCRQTLSLPIYPGMSMEDVRYVSDCVKEIL